MAPFVEDPASTGAPTSCRQDMAKCHRQPETWYETFGETIARGVVVSL